jgi:hypothetical protein
MPDYYKLDEKDVTVVNRNLTAEEKREFSAFLKRRSDKPLNTVQKKARHQSQKAHRATH